MKLINFFMLALMFPLTGCASQPDYTLNPPASTEWVNISLKLPAQVEIMPMDVLYRSDKCKREVYDQKIESHISLENGKNPQVVRMIQQGNGGIWQRRIALDGGGKCKWKLSTVRIDLKLNRNIPLTKGKDPTSVSYVFAFDDEFYSGGGMPGQRKDVHGNLTIKTDFFPMVFINHAFNETDIDMFGGNVRKLQWSRHYRVYETHEIVITPVLHINKVVTLESPLTPPGKVTVTYPDGSQESVSGIIPDYKKLLSML